MNARAFLGFLNSGHPLVDQQEINRFFCKEAVNQFIKYVDSGDYETMIRLGQKRALRIFHSVAENVPAYKTFLQKNRINHKSVKSYQDFLQIPYIDKKNYLTQHEPRDLMWRGQERGISMFSVSSGTSGKHFYWPRSCHLELETFVLHGLFITKVFAAQKQKTLVIVAYSMGMYIAGTFTLNSFQHLARAGYPITVLSPGLSIQDVLQVVKDIGPSHERIIMAGYPPFIRDIIDEGSRSRINWGRLKTSYIFGGENYTEDWKEFLTKTLLHGRGDLTTMNTYGTADAAIVGHESPLSNWIRSNIYRKKLMRDLFGKDTMPTLVHYHPIFKDVSVENEEIIFTSLAGYPLVRYNIHDSGGVSSAAQLLSRLNIDVDQVDPTTDNEFWSKVPMLYLHGRPNVATIYGLNVYSDNIKVALEQLSVIRLVSGKFSIITVEDNKFRQRLKINIELNTQKLNKRQKEIIGTEIVRSLKENNLEFRELSKKINHSLVEINFCPRGFFKQTSSKHKWVQKFIN